MCETGSTSYLGNRPVDRCFAFIYFQNLSPATAAAQVEALTISYWASEFDSEYLFLRLFQKLYQIYVSIYIYIYIYYLKCHNIDSKFSTFETLLEPFGATIELQIFMIFWSPQGPCRQNHVSQISKAWNNESWLKLTRLSRFSGLLCRFCRKKTAAAPLLPHACGCHSPAAPHLARQMTYGILDYLREGFPWPGRPFKHTESISFTVNIR